MSKNISKIIIMALLSLFLYNGFLYAQTGQWISYDLTGFGSGSVLSDRGDGCLVYTRTSSPYLLIFDIRVGEWLKLDMGTSQTFGYVETEGDVVLAWSEEILVGYSSQLETWDTVSYEGTILYENWQAGIRSYGCSDNLAFVATDQKLYVFDITLGYWQEYAFTLPADYSSGKFYSKEDFVVLVLIKSTPNSQPMNVVYSMYTRNFNELENGAYVLPPIYDHGFIRIHNVSGTGEEYKLVGYSVYDNEFDVLTYVTDDETNVEGFWPSSIVAEEFTSHGLGFRKVVTPYELVTCTFYGYDTEHGSWQSMPVSFDWEYEHYYGNSHVGGKFVVDFSNINSSEDFRYFFYSGVDNEFRIKTPGLNYKSTYYSFICGGTVYLAYDTLTAWGYDIAGDRENTIGLAMDASGNRFAGEDWASFSRYTPGVEDSMLIYFYNSNTNSWSSTAMPYDYSISASTTTRYYMYYDWSGGQLLHYSSPRDEITKSDFTPETYVSVKIRGDLAYASSDNRSLLFNGSSGSISDLDFEFNQNGLGAHSAAFYDTNTKTLQGYSALSENWTSQAVTEDLSLCFDTGYVGCISVYYNGSGYNKIYAYNSFGDSWVELIPEGTHVNVLVGDKTILVTRSTKVYAFDPQSELVCCKGTTGNVDCSIIEDPDITDITRLVDFLYLSHAPLCCPEEADADGSGRPFGVPGGDPDVTDIMKIIDFLYLSHAPLAPCP